MPVITVLMTAYNAELYIDRSIKSILDQTFRDFEFLIVDDASTDGTLERIRAWQRKDARVRVIAGERNRGQTTCLNHGLAEARGEWIARQDADDLSHPARLRRLYEMVQADKQLVLVGTNGWLIDVNDRRFGTINVPLNDAAIRWAMPFQNPFIHTAVLFRRLPETTYDEQFHICQDWDLWARLSREGRVRNLPDRLIEYRDYHTSLSKGRAEQTRAEAATIGRRIFAEQFPDEPWTPEIERLLAAFRNGLPPRDHVAFWALYKQLWQLRKDNRDDQIRDAIALHHLQAAGHFGSRHMGLTLSNLAKAITADPSYTMRVLRNRVSVFRHRSVLPEYAKLMKKAPSDDVMDDLDAVRGDR